MTEKSLVEELRASSWSVARGMYSKTQPQSIHDDIRMVKLEDVEQLLCEVAKTFPDFEHYLSDGKDYLKKEHQYIIAVQEWKEETFKGLVEEVEKT